MEQETKQYRSQHEVFFLATLVLFPSKLTVRPLDPWFFRPYFNFAYGNDFNKGFNKEDPSLEWVGVMLDEYKKDGYIRYKKSDSLYKITKIDTEKATKDLIQYLKRWQQNKLSPISASKPPDAEHQQEMLLDAIVRARAGHQNEPRITLEDVYGKRGDYAYDAPFWELVLSYQLIDGKVEIKKADYDRRADYLYEDNAQPYVEYKIVDKKLLGLIEQRVAQKTKPTPPTTPTSIVMVPAEQRAWLTMPKKHVLAELASGDTYQISKQKTGLKTDLAPYTIMKRLTKHPTLPITLKYANEKLDGCEDVDDLSEIIRQCGFDEAKKDMFFEISTAQKVKLKEDVRLSTDDVALLAN